MYKLNISPKAKDDLVEIKEYISQELCNPQAASNIISKLMRKIRILSDYPKVGTQLGSVIDIQSEYRFIVCDNYLIFYRYEDQAVFVSRILYSRRDYMRVLFEVQEIEKK